MLRTPSCAPGVGEGRGADRHVCTRGKALAAATDGPPQISGSSLVLTSGFAGLVPMCLIVQCGLGAGLCSARWSRDPAPSPRTSKTLGP